METFYHNNIQQSEDNLLYIGMSDFIEMMESNNAEIPYKSTFSLTKYIDYIKGVSEPKCAMTEKMLVPMMNEAEEYVNQDVMQCEMMQAKAANLLLPSMMMDNEKSFIAAPFAKTFVKRTKALEKFFEDDEWQMIIDPSTFDIRRKILAVGSFILKQCYDIDTFDYMTDHYTFRHKETGIERHEVIELKMDFVEVVQEKPLLPLSKDDIRKLLEHTEDESLWLEMLPPDRFSLKGFVQGTLHDVTQIQIHTKMRALISEVGSVTDPLKFLDLVTRNFQSYLGDASIRIGVSNVQYVDLISSDSDSISLTGELDIRKITSTETMEGQCLYSDAIYRNKTIILDDISDRKRPAQAIRKLRENGIQSVILIPVENEKGKITSVIEIGSTRVHGVNNITMMRLQEMIGLQKLLINNFYKEIDKQVDLLIRDQFTSIHPSVEWKFKEVATKYRLNQIDGVEEMAMEPVAFENVYPLYGQADIVGSSRLRNEALREDLLFNLKSLERLMTIWLEHKQLFLLQSYHLKVKGLIEQITEDFVSSDESSLIEMLHAEIHPFLESIKGRYDDLPEAPYVEYISILDSKFGIVYDKRKKYEESVNLLNKKISDFFLKADQSMQEILPHYFEKYKTDGVEYNVYIGQSLLENGTFTDNDLREFRIWQLQKMIEVTNLVKKVSPTLAVPVTTAQLIFVYNNDLNIRFRMEEKKFDVDGAYNVRYEILKKRIDKATIKDTNERLTVEGKIAIVYLQDREKREYLEYIDFLKHSGAIADEVEDLALNKLQGADGLRALRITVK